MNEKLKTEIEAYLNHDKNIGYEYQNDLLIATNSLYQLSKIEKELDEISFMHSCIIKNDGEASGGGIEMCLKDLRVGDALKDSLAFLQEWKNEFEQLDLEPPEEIDQLMKASQNYQREMDNKNWHYNQKLITDLVDSDEKFVGCFSIEGPRENIEIRLAFIDEFRQGMARIYSELENNGVLENTFAFLYKQSAESIESTKKGDDLEDFILNFNDIKQSKAIEKKVKHTLEMTQSQEIKKAMFFEDNSVLLQTNDNQMHVPDIGMGVIQFNENVIKPVLNNYIDYTFRKKPKYKHFFQSIINDSSMSSNCFNEVMEVIESVKENEQLIKAEKPQLLDDLKFQRYDNMEEQYMRLSNETFKEPPVSQQDNEKKYRALMEGLLDELDEIKYQHQVKKYTKSIISKKYEFLIDDTNHDWFRVLYDDNISKNKLEEAIGAKLASYKTPEMLTQALVRFHNSINEFTMDNILERTNDLNVEVVDRKQSEKDKFLILKINDYDASNKMGAPSWCISTREVYFNNYTRDDCEQYFIYDFTKNAKNNDSMLGITLTKEGNVDAMHYKNDDSVRENDIKEKWRNVINQNVRPKTNNKMKNR